MFGIFDLLDNIIPFSDTSRHDMQRLEFLCACKIMENRNNILKILPYIPASLFDDLLQSAIHKCYLEFINSGPGLRNSDQYNNKEIVFPDTLVILILNYPENEYKNFMFMTPLHSPMQKQRVIESYPPNLEAPKDKTTSHS